MNTAILALRADPIKCGTYIAKKIWPKEFRSEGFQNVRKYDLNQNWRLIYTISHKREGKLVLIYNWMNHTDYNRLFGYG